MKNLKKVLALGLALVMILGMFTIASAAETKKVATDLTDFDQVTNKEAVSLMVDLGVIKGLPDGSYNPSGAIDRASWAKMVYFIITNDDDASVYIPSTGNVFADVPNTHWAAGEIAYLKTLGIVAGDGTNFRPSDTITMVEAYKIMLTGIGYNAENEKYVGANWAGNVIKDAARLGLTDKISLKQGDELTRDVAARIVYNALDCRVVELNEKQIGNIGTMIDGYKYYDTLAFENFKIAKKILTVTSVDEDGIATFSGSDAAKMNDVKASASDVGRTVQIWANVTKNAKDELQFNSAKSTSAFPADIEATKVVTGGVDLDKAYTKGEDDYCGLPADEDGVEYIMDGKGGLNKSDVLAAAKVSGNVVEFYDDDESGTIDLVKVTTYSVAKIGDIKTRTVDGKLEVSVAKAFNGYVPADRVNGYAALAKDDVVLVNVSTIGKNNDVNVYNLEKAEKISGKVSSASSDAEITVGGTKYKLSGVYGASDFDKTDFAAWEDWDSEYDFFTGKDGKLCYAVITEEGIDTSKVAMVLETLFVTGGDIDVSNNVRAKLLFTDGTTENVTLTKLDGKKIVETGAKEDQKNLEDVKLRSMFYNYKVDKDGKYELTAMDSDEAGKWAANKTTADASTLAIAKKPEFTTGYSSDSKTLFIVDKLDKDNNSTFTTYTGYANVPKMNEGAVKTITAATEKDAKSAKYVFIQTTAFADDKPDGLVYLRNDGYSYNSADGCYEINIVDAKGAATTLKVATDVKFDGTAISFAKGVLSDKDLKFYTVESVTDGIVDELKTVTADTGKVVVSDTISVVNGVVSVTDNGVEKTYEVNDSTVMVWIDLKANSDKDGEVYGSCGIFEAGDLSTDASEYPGGVEATVVLNEDTADFIYVVRSTFEAPAEEG